MTFIKCNYLDGRTFGFSLDQLATFEAKVDDLETAIVLTTGQSEKLPIDIEDFVAKVFSDESGDGEYRLVEIDEKEPPETRWTISPEDIPKLFT